MGRRPVTVEAAVRLPRRSLATEWFSDDTIEHPTRLRSRDLVAKCNDDRSVARRVMPDRGRVLPGVI